MYYDYRLYLQMLNPRLWTWCHTRHARAVADLLLRASPQIAHPTPGSGFLPRAAVRRLSTVVDGKSPEVLHPFAYSQARDVSGNANSSGAFDWRQSVLLAAASFEAYFGLAREINAPDVTRSGARITYVDRQFVRDHLDGLVEVRLLDISGIDYASAWLGSQVSGTFQLGIRQLDNAPVESCKTLVDSITELATKAEFSVPWVASNKDDGSPEPEKVESKHEHPLDARTLHRRLMYVRDAGSPPPLHIVLKHAWIGRDPERFASGKLDLKGLLDGRQHRIELALEPDSSNAQQQVKKKKTSEKKQTSEGATEALDREQLPGVSLSLRLIPFSDILEHRSETTLSTIFGHPSESFENNPWKALLEEAAPSALSQPPLSPLCFIDEPETDSQVWVFANIQHRTLCIAFRGTEQDSWRDMLTDISMAPALVEPGKIPELCNHSGLAATAKQPSLMQDLMKRLKSARKQLESDEDGEKDEQSSSPKDGAAFWKGLLEGKRRDGPRARQILEQLWRAVYESDLSGAFRTGGLTAEDMQAQPWVHQGFLTAYDSVRSAVMEMAELAMIRTKRREGSGSWRVLVTGHSLGGALATLCAYDLALHRWPEGVVAPQISMYNYGSPRVGNRKFAKEYNRLVPDSWRIMNNMDAVCSIPRLMGYCHVGHAVRLLGKGKVEIQRDTSLAQGEGVAMPDLLPALAGMLAVSMPELKSRALALVLASIPARGEETVRNLAKGTAQEAAQTAQQAAQTAEQAAQKLWEEEVAAWRTLLTRDAISEHFEEFYLDALKACISEALELERKNGDSERRSL